MERNRQWFFLVLFICAALPLNFCGKGGSDTTIVPPPTQNSPTSSAPTFSNTQTGSTDALEPLPDTPANLSAAALSDSSIQLSWSPGTIAGDGFMIERSADGTGFVRIGTAAANAREYIDTALSASTSYQYRIRAYSSTGSSGYSNLAAATTNAPPAGPPVPLPGVPRDLLATGLSSTSIRLAWTPGMNSDGFIIERSVDAASFVQIGGAGANAAEYTDIGLAPATRYYYRMRAYNGTGISDYSDIATGTTNEAPAPAAAFAYKALVALFTFADDASRPVSLSQIQDFVINNTDALTKYVQETSYGKASLAADFIDWTPLPGTAASYKDRTNALIEDAILKLDGVADLRNYTHVFVIYPGREKPACAEAYTAALEFITPRAGTFRMRILDIGTDCLIPNPQDTQLPQRMLEHEFGHTLGLYHAYAFDCGGSTHLPKNLFDLSMCGPTLVDFTTAMSAVRGQYSAMDKMTAGWLDPGQIQDDRDSGEYVLDQFELPSPGLKAVRIPAGFNINGSVLYYWLEYRKGIGIFDAQENEYFRAQPVAGPSPLMDMLYLRLKPVQFLTSEGSNVEPDEFIFAIGFPYKTVSAADLNQPFLDPYRGIKVELLEKTGAGADARAKVRISRSAVKADPEGLVYFGSVGAGIVSQKTITITNTGTAPVHLGDAAIEGDAYFTIAVSTCAGVDLATNTSCSVTLNFATSFPGQHMAALVVGTSDPLRPSLSVPVFGAGTGGKESIAP